MKDMITVENTQDVISEVENAFFDIPFENSRFQTESFVIGGQITPERAYRAIGLRMHAKLRALNEAKFGRMKEQVDIDEIDYKLQNESLTPFDRRREEIKKQEILSRRTWTDKLINDAISELNVLYKHFKSLPKFTREQFEAGERLHFEQRLNRQALGLEGARESLINMNEDIRAISTYEQQVAQLENSATEVSLIELSKSMPNILKEMNKREEVARNTTVG
jgi:hypothetical protein